MTTKPQTWWTLLSGHSFLHIVNSTHPHCSPKLRKCTVLVSAPACSESLYCHCRVCNIQIPKRMRSSLCVMMWCCSVSVKLRLIRHEWHGVSEMSWWLMAGTECDDHSWVMQDLLWRACLISGCHSRGHCWDWFQTLWVVVRDSRLQTHSVGIRNKSERCGWRWMEPLTNSGFLYRKEDWRGKTAVSKETWTRLVRSKQSKQFVRIVPFWNWTIPSALHFKKLWQNAHSTASVSVLVYSFSPPSSP